MRIIDLTGQRFGRLTVICREGSIDNKPAWKCQCDCGNECIVRGKNLREGYTRSCGCLSRERAAEIGRTKNVRHGMFGTRIYRIWSGMLRRCRNEHTPEYPLYGGRGISVCSDWNSFEAFHGWAKNSGYAEGLTIDRIDNDGDYCSENCRWVDAKAQANNRRTNVMITYNGITRTRMEWAEFFNVEYYNLKKKIDRNGVDATFSALFSKLMEV